MYAEISTWGLGNPYDPSQLTAGFHFTGGITNLYTAQPGFTCKLGTTNYQDTGYIVLLNPFNYYFTFSSPYQVISNVTDKIVSEGTFTCRVGRLEAWTAPGYKMIFIYDIKNNNVQIKRMGFAPAFNADFIA